MKLIILATLTITCFVSYSQTAIEGLGKFKLLKVTTAYLDTLAKEKSLDREKIKTSQDNIRFNNRKGKLAEIFPDTVDSYKSPIYAHQCRSVRVFFIPSIDFSGIELANTYLTFDNDTLVDIQTDYKTEVIEALKAKYGNPEIEKKENEEKCKFSYSGNEVKFTETMYYQKWSNARIKCVAVIGSYRNSQCEKKTLSYINISVEGKTTEIVKCDLLIQAELEKVRTANKKTQLSDF